MPESTEKTPVQNSRLDRLTNNQKFVIGCFAIWCASSVAQSAIRGKTLDKHIALEALKAANRS